MQHLGPGDFAHIFIVYDDKEMVYSVKAGTRDAKLSRTLDAGDRITKSAEVTTSDERCSYPRGEARCGGG